MRISMKVSLTKICVLFVSIGLFVILLSESAVYLRLRSTGLISGPQKTLVFAWMLFWSFVEILQNRKKLNKAYIIFLVFTFVTLVSTALGVTQDISIPRQLIHITVFSSVFTAFYIGTKQLGKETPIKLIKIMYLVMAFTYLCGKLANRNGDSTANTVYYVLMFLPATAFIKTKSIRYVSYIFQILAVLQSNKRTALIAILAYFACLELQANRNISIQKMFLKAAVCCVALTAIWICFPYVTSWLNVTVFDELSIGAIQQDGGSNRLYIYNQVWNAQKSSGLQHWLIGDGYNSVLMSRVCTDGVLGENVSAHNDFLEVLYDYGLFGLVLYVSFFWNLLFRNGAKYSESNYKKQFYSSIIMVLIISITSHLVIYLNYYAIIFAFWGICLAEYDKASVCDSKQIAEKGILAYGSFNNYTGIQL